MSTPSCPPPSGHGPWPLPPTPPGCAISEHCLPPLHPRACPFLGMRPLQGLPESPSLTNWNFLFLPRGSCWLCAP